MTIFRLADKIASKYKTAAASEEEKREADIRRSLLDLWALTNNKTYDILRLVASSHISGKPDSEKERNAQRGYKFVNGILSVIDQLKTNLNTVPISDVEKKLKAVMDTIEEEAVDGGRDTVDFPDLTDFIFLLGKNARNFNQSDKRWVDTNYGKIRTVITRIHSLADAIVTKIMRFRGEEPEKKYRHHQRRRLEPRRAPIYKGDIVDFLRQYGPEYGLNSYDDWQVAFEHDQELKEQITTVINALNRAKTPKDEAAVKMQLAEVMHAWELRKKTNIPALEMGENEFKEVFRPRFVSPELKKERLQEQSQKDEAKQEEWEKLQEIVRKRDEANKRHQLEYQEELRNKELEQKQREIEEDRERHIRSEGESRLEQILKRYQ